MAVAIPVGDSLDAMILFPGTPSGPMWYVEVDFRRLLFDLLLCQTEEPGYDSHHEDHSQHGRERGEP